MKQKKESGIISVIVRPPIKYSLSVCHRYEELIHGRGMFSRRRFRFEHIRPGGRWGFNPFNNILERYPWKRFWSAKLRLILRNFP
mmetsp:Transcript_23846/g.57757  ORF Transcript_23846/g.57757 Transcript_23846/m.57757 type:complete len:85 (-) Transcript_23846:1659-1913(-)